jgi:hypothetical protein
VKGEGSAAGAAMVESAAAAFLSGEAMPYKSTVSRLMAGEAVMSELMRAAHRVPRETLTSAAVMPTMMVPSMTVAGPSTSRPFLSMATAGPTVTNAALMPVADEFKPASTTEALTAAMRTVRRECWFVARTTPAAAVWASVVSTSAASTKGVWTNAE